jgi:hypothetical protein
MTLSLLEHHNNKVPYKKFVENYIFSIFSGTTAANATFLKKNIVPLIYCNFSRKGLLKSAILVYAAILDYFKKKFFHDLFVFEG